MLISVIPTIKRQGSRAFQSESCHCRVGRGRYSFRTSPIQRIACAQVPLLDPIPGTASNASRPSRGRSQTGFLHSLCQFLVIEGLARRLHGREQGAIRVPIERRCGHSRSPQLDAAQRLGSKALGQSTNQVES
jgi:hypothetical protein